MGTEIDPALFARLFPVVFLPGALYLFTRAVRTPALYERWLVRALAAFIVPARPARRS